MPPPSQSLDLEGLLRQTRRLKRQVAAFEQHARDVVEPLDRELSSAEIKAMTTPKANIVGTLENLLNQDLGPVVRQLEELTGLLEKPSGRPARGDGRGASGRAEP